MASVRELEVIPCDVSPVVMFMQGMSMILLAFIQLCFLFSPCTKSAELLLTEVGVGKNKQMKNVNFH